ncbi:MAG: methyltransferase domain-containing protein [Bacteroidales bacterium]|nr:methyltransferase domain-containing protein [Bacteroidales bacterium]MDD4639538.1 methyltransferase domain-containing protein [Bacteroidales bacterium]
MKIGTPVDKDSLSIKRGYKVLEVGPGSNPTKRANVLAEKFLEDETHRRGAFKIYPHQRLVEADGENLPFADKEFDYVICSHVLEHVNDPEKFIREQERVAGMGYIETPSLIGEWLSPKQSHKWVLLEIDNRIVMFEKERIIHMFSADFGDLFLNYLPYHSILFRLLTTSRQNFVTVRHEWKESVDLVVNPPDDILQKFFTEKWSPDMVARIFTSESACRELRGIIKSLSRLSFEKLSRVFSLAKKPLTLSEYKELKKHR